MTPDGALSALAALLFQLVQFALVLALAPLLTGFVRWVKARLNARRGAAPWQPYRDLLRLMRKQPVAADGTGWLFLTAPLAVFTLVWVAAAIVPSWTTHLALASAADLIVLAGLLTAARVLTALAALEPGTAFGGIGASREMMIGALAEPALLMVSLSYAILFGTSSLVGIVTAMVDDNPGLRISLALGALALAMVALAECGRIPVDNPATHLELTMVHEAMVLEHAGRHLALLELAGMVRLLLFASLLGALVLPWSIAGNAAGPASHLVGLLAYVGKLAVAGALLALFENLIAKMRVFRVAEFLGAAALIGLMAVIFLFVSRGL